MVIMAEVADVFYETDVLQKDGSRNRQFWKGEAVQLADGNYAHRTDSWMLKSNGEEGKHRVSKPTVTETKNEGKANERTPKEQAISEIESKKDKKLDKRYWPVGEPKPDFLVMPMSAKKYGVIEGGEFNSKRGPDKVDFPAYVQPKLDGIRLLFDGEKGWSRKLKVFGQHCWDWILPEGTTLRSGVHLDGELMLPPDEFSFQETVSAVRTEESNELSQHLEFHLFDVYLENNPSMSFSGRLNMMESLVEDYSERVKIVPTQKVNDHEAVLDAHSKFVAKGHEGSIVRTGSGTYKDATTRSGDLLKLKGFTDEEFEITGVREGKGKFEGMAIFFCETDEGQSFEVTPKGTEEDRRRMFDERDQIVGKDLTVRFQNYSDDGIPRFPVGLAIRDYE